MPVKSKPKTRVDFANETWRPTKSWAVVILFIIGSAMFLINWQFNPRGLSTGDLKDMLTVLRDFILVLMGGGASLFVARNFSKKDKLEHERDITIAEIYDDDEGGGYPDAYGRPNQPGAYPPQSHQNQPSPPPGWPTAEKKRME